MPIIKIIIEVASAATDGDCDQPIKNNAISAVDGMPASTPPSLAPNFSAMIEKQVIHKLPITNEEISFNKNS